jgi:hypothetical protein
VDAGVVAGGDVEAGGGGDGLAIVGLDLDLPAAVQGGAGDGRGDEGGVVDERALN